MDLFGIFFGSKKSIDKWDSYYGTIDALSPLFDDEEFNETVSGFYLNHIDESVRISYFVSRAKSSRAISKIRDFFRRNGISEIGSQLPRPAIVAANYGGEELEERFRYFLALETQVRRELINTNLMHARALFATYCFQVRKASLPARQHFEPTFVRASQTYVSLPIDEKKLFLNDLQTRLSWTHMMVNLVLGCDFQVPIEGRPLSIPEINHILRSNDLGFQIPADWEIL